MVGGVVALIVVVEVVVVVLCCIVLNRAVEGGIWGSYGTNCCCSGDVCG